MDMSNRTTNGSMQSGLGRTTSLSPAGSNGVSYFSNLGQAIAETNLRKVRPRPLQIPKIGRTKPLVSALGRLGLAVATRNPYVQAANMAFRVAYGVDIGNPWASQGQPEPGEWLGWDFSGLPDLWNYHCNEPMTAGACGVVVATGYASCPGGNCNTGGHVGSPSPSYTDPLPVTQPAASAPPGWVASNILAGPLNATGGCGSPANRFTIKLKMCRKTTARQPAPLFAPSVFAPGKQVDATPLPRLDPPPSTITEETRGTGTNDRPDIIRGYKPYARVGIRADGNGPPTDDLHILRPPGPDEKEKKKKEGARRALALVGALYDATTEAGDIIGVLYDCMNKKRPYVPGKPANMSVKANWIYNNLGSLDIDCAVSGLIRNHLEDKYIYGKIFGTVGKHTGYGSMGPSHGGWMAQLPT